MLSNSEVELASQISDQKGENESTERNVTEQRHSSNDEGALLLAETGAWRAARLASAERDHELSPCSPLFLKSFVRT